MADKKKANYVNYVNYIVMIFYSIGIQSNLMIYYANFSRAVFVEKWTDKKRDILIKVKRQTSKEYKNKK